MTNVAVIYYSATGNVHRLAQAVAEGAAQTGADVRLRRASETAPDAAIDSRPEWRAHLEATADVPDATLDDLTWADGLAFGTPSRFGNVAAQLKTFLDSTGPLWAAGKLADRAATGFASAGTRHGGNEATVLALYQTMHHWGAVVVAPGYTDRDVPAGGQSPYGTAHPSADGPPDDATLAAARHQGRRLARYARAVADVRDAA